MTILDQIVVHKKQEVASLPSITIPNRVKRSFVQAMLSTHPSLIAEVKPRSPSQVELLARHRVPEIVNIYNKHAQAISVLCDNKYFGGGFDLLAEVRTLTDKPLLAKEFIVSERQIDHAYASGADAVLLIAAILSPDELQKFTAYAISLGLDVLIEVHNEQDIETVAELSEECVLVGINNRDLHTLETDIRTTQRLVPLIKQHFPEVKIITESGISNSTDVQRLAPFVQGFLIGTSILQSNDPESLLTSLFSL